MIAIFDDTSSSVFQTKKPIIVAVYFKSLNVQPVWQNKEFIEVVNEELMQVLLKESENIDVGYY